MAMEVLHVLIRMDDARRWGPLMDGEAFASWNNAANIDKKAPVNFILTMSLTSGVFLTVWTR